VDRRRRIAVIATFVTVLAVCAIAVPLARGQATPARERGELTQLVQNTAAHQGTSRTRLATDHDHMAVISAQAVTYFDQTDAQYRTDITTQFEVTDLFDRGGFTNYRVDAAATTGALLGEVLPILLFALIAGLVFRQLRGGGMIGGIGKSRARTINPGEMSGVTFADVAGADEAVAELSEVVNILRNPDRYAELGARIPRGVMLVGPPGTGKTLLAKAVAGEAGVPFFSVSGSAFVEMFVGVGASRIRDLFAEARKRGSAIIFIDEIDAVGRRRGANGGHSNDEREQTLNQLLVEMDGFDTTTPVIVMAASNRADVLDPALLRPGRFDRCVVVDTPDIIGRAAILGVHSRGKPLSTGVDLAVIARQTPGFSGAELANIINEAALLTARAERKVIEMPDLEEACLRVQAGPERANRLLSDGELRVIAYHEMGHALVGHTLEHSDPVHRISIVSRGRALGWTMQLPERDQVLSSRAQMTDRLAGLLGGRVSEEMIFGGDMITSGAADDIERATALARRMVT
jgi:cell division protease FtsH